MVVESVDNSKRDKPSVFDDIIENAKNDELFFGCLFVGLGVGMLLDDILAGALLGIGFWIIIRYLKKDSCKSNV